MPLQFAMDTLTTEAALELAAVAAPHVDILKLGAPLIKAEGLRSITAVKEAHPDKTVLADLKTMDAGDSTIAGAVKAAEKHGKGVVVDLIGVADKAARAEEAVALGAKFVEMHAGLDEQADEGFTFATLLRDGEASGVPFSVAGGVKAATIPDVQDSGALIAVAGSAIYSAPSVGDAAAELRAAIR